MPPEPDQRPHSPLSSSTKPGPTRRRRAEAAPATSLGTLVRIFIVRLRPSGLWRRRNTSITKEAGEDRSIVPCHQHRVDPSSSLRTTDQGTSFCLAMREHSLSGWPFSAAAISLSSNSSAYLQIAITSSARSWGTTTTPVPSARMKSLLRTETPPTWTASFTDSVLVRVLPLIGTACLARNGMPVLAISS